MLGEPRALRQILVNMLSEAVARAAHGERVVAHGRRRRRAHRDRRCRSAANGRAACRRRARWRSALRARCSRCRGRRCSRSRAGRRLARRHRARPRGAARFLRRTRLASCAARQRQPANWPPCVSAQRSWRARDRLLLEPVVQLTALLRRQLADRRRRTRATVARFSLASACDDAVERGLELGLIERLRR